MNTNNKITFLISLFISLFIAVNLIGSKIINFCSISVSVGIFIVPILFLITDIIEEVLGKKYVSNLIITSLICLGVVYIFLYCFINATPAHRFTYDNEYKLIFNLSLRMILASTVAFFFSQLNDMYIYFYLKKISKDKYLWIRNNVSTILSQAIDTLIFMLIAFYHISPKFTFAYIIHLSIPYYLLKVCFAIIDTPFVYLGVKWLKGGENGKSKSIN